MCASVIGGCSGEGVREGCCTHRNAISTHIADGVAREAKRLHLCGLDCSQGLRDEWDGLEAMR